MRRASLHGGRRVRRRRSRGHRPGEGGVGELSSGTAAGRRGDPAPVTVRDLLSLPCLAPAEVAAGAAGLDRPVRWVHVSELLDISRWLIGGEFLLTTGMKLREISPAQQRAYAESLVRSGLAALGLELFLWLQEPPAPLVEVFEKAGVPLLVWRADLRFGAITEEVTRRLLERRGSGPRIDEAELTEELLSGNVLEPLLADRLEAAGLEMNQWCTVMVFARVSRSGGQDASPPGPELVSAVRSAVPPARSGSGPLHAARLGCSRRGRLVKVVLTGPSPEALLAGCNRAADAVRQAAGFAPGLRLLWGVGRPRRSLHELPGALREAVAVMRFRARTRHDRAVDLDEIRLARLLLATPPTELRQFVQEELGPVLALPPAEAQELKRTLEALLQANFNVSAAAQRLHLRRQSLYRRMRKLTALLGPGLDRCERRATLLLALRAHELLWSDGDDPRDALASY